jgi:hypothetical protein
MLKKKTEDVDADKEDEGSDDFEIIERGHKRLKKLSPNLSKAKPMSKATKKRVKLHKSLTEYSTIQSDTTGATVFTTAISYLNEPKNAPFAAAGAVIPYDILTDDESR